MFGLLKDLNKLRYLIAREDKWKFVLLLAMMFAGSLLEAISIGIIPVYVSLIMKPSSLSGNKWVGDWFTGLPGEPDVTVILWGSALLLTFIVLKNVFLVCIFYVQSRIVNNQQFKLGDRMFRVYHSAPYDWHLQRSSSQLLRNIQNDTAGLLRGVIMPFLDLVMAVITGIVIISVMIVSVPGIAFLGLLVTGIGLFLMIRLTQKKLQYIGKVVWTEYAEIVKSIQQGFGALVDGRINGCEEYLRKQHGRALWKQTRAQFFQSLILKSTPYVIETFAIIGLLLILLILIKISDNLADALPMMALLSVATIRLKQMAVKVGASINTMMASRIYIPSIVKDINELEKKGRAAAESAEGVVSTGKFNVLQINNISYSYPFAETSAVNNISLKVKRGESIAFVGSTGCGKSTLANLILGLLSPMKGEIRCNGRDIHSDIYGWWARLGYIPQTIFLLDETIRANIAFGVDADKIDESHLWSILRTACLDEFVMSLPDGLNTVVGERGVRLSGGQRQRIGIARALYTQPEVLVMDEATSALDNKTEVDVMRAIKNLKQDRTLIMIAHRLSTVRDCDCLYLMQNGEILSSGTYEDLERKSSVFRGIAVAKVVEE